MPPSISKKAESLKAETKKLEDIAKKKVQSIEKTEKEEGENTRKEVLQISLELENFKKKTEDVMNGTVEDTGWDEQAIRVGEKMKYVIEQESRVQHNLLLKTDEATKELELKAKPIMKELPLVSDFSEEDRVQMLTGIDKSIKKLKQKRELIEMAESKLNRKMQVLMECTPDPTEDKQTILSKLQMSYDVVSGANDPDRARESVLKQLNPSSRLLHQKKNPANQNPNPSPGRSGTSSELNPRLSPPRSQGKLSSQNASPTIHSSQSPARNTRSSSPTRTNVPPTRSNAKPQTPNNPKPKT